MLLHQVAKGACLGSLQQQAARVCAGFAFQSGYDAGDRYVGVALCEASFRNVLFGSFISGAHCGRRIDASRNAQGEIVDADGAEFVGEVGNFEIGCSCLCREFDFLGLQPG